MTRSMLRSFLFVAFLFSTLSACRYLPPSMQPQRTIDNPKPDTPEWLIFEFIKGAQEEDTLTAYGQIKGLLHHTVYELRASEQSFVDMNFPAFQRKVKNYTLNPGTGTYKLDYEVDVIDDKEVQLFIVNHMSDQPSPFRITRDPKANNAWRIRTIP